MQDTITLALDAMGGSQAPQSVVEGAAAAHARFPHVRFIFFGEEAKVLPLLKKHKSLEEASTFVPTSVTITDDMKPSQAIRMAKESSMGLAIAAVKEGKAHGVISGGNTGAYMAMSKIMLRTIPGISRPAIATYLPTQRSESVMLDLGANIECDAVNLVEFALMGSLFATDVLGIDHPSVGLLNVGEEELKGSQTLREAAEILKSYKTLNFHGFVEGDDIGKGTVDVIVTDGFTGNVALKTIEGTARLLKHFLTEAFSSSLFSKLSYLVARPTFKVLQARMNPNRYNGAIFLGLNGIAIKSHGSTDAVGFASAISVGIDMVSHGFKQKIEEEAPKLKDFIDSFLLAEKEQDLAPMPAKEGTSQEVKQAQ